MPLSPPLVRDLEGWQQAVLEHRRALLEKLIAEYPAVLKTHRTKVELLRIKLSGVRTGDYR